MSYEPLHHKYRPQTFAELVGQEAIASTLSNALRQQRIAPAYLFTGARGTGKTSSARIFAKSLNCLSADVPTSAPCGTCEVCRAIANGSALDVIEIDAASNTGVDNIRELIERAQFAPVQCRYKVYVIDEVHMLSNAAFNALLKTLEEPPAQVVFVLATTDPQRVLPTIISRCQRFDFRRIPLDAMVQHLRAIAQKESIAITDEGVQLVSQISQGGLRDAESLLDQLSLMEGEIGADHVWDLVGAVPERDLLALMRAIAQDNPEALLDQVRHLMDRGREPTIVLQNLAGFYRDLLIAKTAPNRGDLVAITPQTWVEMGQFVEAISLSLLQQGQQQLRESEPQIRNSAQPRLWLEVTLMGLLPSAMVSPVADAPVARAWTPPTAPSQPAATPSVAPAMPVERSPHPAIPAPPPVSPPPPPTVTAPSQATPSQAAPSQAAPSQPPAAVPTPAAATEQTASPVAASLDETWQQALGLVQPNSTQILLRQQCFLLGYTGQEARIGVKAAPLLNMAKSKLRNIEAAFEQFAGRRIHVSLEVADSPGMTAPTATSISSPTAPTTAAPVSAPTAASTVAPIAASLAASTAVPPPAPPQTTHVPAPAPAPAPPPIAAPVPEATAPSPLASTAPPPRDEWHEDPVARAARTLATFFNGQVINLDDDGTGDTAIDWSALDPGDMGTEGDDVPF